MKKREFQKKAAAALLGKLADVVMELEENPNITITSEYHSSYFKLRKNYNLIQISVKQTGELTYQLTDMLGNTGRSQIYVQYHAGDDPEHLIKKFVEDFGRLYKDFLLAGTLHDFVRCRYRGSIKGVRGLYQSRLPVNQNFWTRCPEAERREHEIFTTSAACSALKEQQ